MKTNTPDGSPVRLFKSKQDWAVWLEKNHRKSTGLWLRLAKKASRLRSVSYKEALEVALCYGWIDGQKRPESEQAWLQRFLSRSSKSIWSKINREKALVLIASGEMKAAGLEAIENAKKNGRWDAAYDSPSGATVPSDFQAALDANPRATAFFKTLDRANRYAVLWRIQTVRKAETRARKIEQFIGMLERGEKIHSAPDDHRRHHHYGGNQAFTLQPATLCNETWDEEDYYPTALHELADHAKGPKRVGNLFDPFDGDDGLGDSQVKGA